MFYLSKFTEMIIKFAKSYTDLCLDEEDDILSSNLNQLQDLTIRICNTREFLFDDYRKGCKCQKSHVKNLDTKTTCRK